MRSPCPGRYSPSAPRPSGCSLGAIAAGIVLYPPLPAEHPRVRDASRRCRPRRWPPPTPPRPRAPRTAMRAPATAAPTSSTAAPSPRPGPSACSSTTPISPPRWPWAAASLLVLAAEIIAAVYVITAGPDSKPLRGLARPGRRGLAHRHRGGRLAGHAAAPGLLRPGQAQDDRSAVGRGHVLAAGGPPARPALLRRTCHARGRRPDPPADRPYQPASRPTSPR